MVRVRVSSEYPKFLPLSSWPCWFPLTLFCSKYFYIKNVLLITNHIGNTHFPPTLSQVSIFLPKREGIDERQNCCSEIKDHFGVGARMVPNSCWLPVPFFLKGSFPLDCPIYSLHAGVQLEWLWVPREGSTPYNCQYTREAMPWRGACLFQHASGI